MNRLQIEKGSNRRIKVRFPYYNATQVSKIKSIKGHEWHPEGKYWLFSNTNGTLEKILRVFEGAEIYWID